MRKTAAFFLLSVYIVTQTVSVCWYFYKSFAHSYFLEQSRDNPAGGSNGLISITIDQNKWSELKNGEDEIIIDDVLYDVERAVASGTTMHLLLKRDSDETNWNAHYKKITNLLYKHIGERHATSGKLSFTLFPLFYSKETTTSLCLVKYLDKIPQCTSAHFFPSPVKELVTPPPKSC